ncbi:hypothetical protein Btru_027626 [Bulinus truncatus]|nr:hypothetical protein Btru_027626 [Bulinus truncatus]
MTHDMSVQPDNGHPSMSYPWTLASPGVDRHFFPLLFMTSNRRIIFQTSSDHRLRLLRVEDKCELLMSHNLVIWSGHPIRSPQSGHIIWSSRVVTPFGHPNLVT